MEAIGPYLLDLGAGRMATTGRGRQVGKSGDSAMLRVSIVFRLLLAASVLGACAAVAIGTAASSAGAAAPSPPGVRERTASTVTSDVLPTVQIDRGVVWTTTVVGNTVYAGGSFSRARPAGAAPGTRLIVRHNALAFDIRTGGLLAKFAPSINGAVKVVRASPDGTRLYVGGSFSSVNGRAHYNLVAFSTATGRVLSTFKAQVGGSYVNAIAATRTMVFVGGLIS